MDNNTKHTNEEYREMLNEFFMSIEDNDKLEYFYEFCTERFKGMH